MQPEMTSREEITVVGYTVRTSNELEANPSTAKISKLWQRFLGDKVAEKIRGRVKAHAIYAVYTDYQSDEKGPYSLTLGFEVEGFLSAPEGMVVRKIPRADYAVFTSPRGPIPEIIFETWKSIWNFNARQLGLRRSYKADFERYDERSRDPSQAQVDIFIGVEPLTH